MEEFYTVNQAAIALKVHPLTVRRYIKEGKLKAVRVGGNVRIALNDLRAFTQDFIPHTKQVRVQTAIQTKTFNFNDPLLRLKGIGMNMSKLESS
ncbi:MAG: helix-turn-helix domain-containing protein [Candidatus Daviesbacteria bacterium]|nr:helix-turn-helix domain-containing protein [Candidatus Daviesbacteria bacterium]